MVGHGLIDRRMHRGLLGVAVALAALLALWLCQAPRAHAVEPHAFDPVLSLTGGCTTSTIDAVADPSNPPCPEGDHPGSFNRPHSVATDRCGNIFVASLGKLSSGGTAGRVDIFDAGGFYITTIEDPTAAASSVAVDSKNNLYVFQYRPPTETTDYVSRIVRYTPTTNNPCSGELAYDAPPVVVAELSAGSNETGIAVNNANDHLFVHLGISVAEYGSAEEGNPLLDDTIGEGIIFNVRGVGIAVDAEHERLYLSDNKRVRVLELDEPHALLMTIEGSDTSAGVEFANFLSVAADEKTGHFFIFDGEGTNVVYEFAENGEYLSTISHDFQSVSGQQIAIDNGPQSPNGGLNPGSRYLYVPSHPGGIGHLFAFGSQDAECQPSVGSLSFANVTAGEAELRATVNPCNGLTSYAFEYTPEQLFEEQGFSGAAIAGQGQLPSVGSDLLVSTALTGLTPGTTYRFRIVATNGAGADQEEGTFATYPSPGSSIFCPNSAVRTGLSGALPDCRAYELVTPPDTNARSPIGVGYLGIYFLTREAAPSGDRVSFQIEGGSLPGIGGTGAFGGDPYLATRGSNGWSTISTGPNGYESPALLPGSTSPDQGYSFWSTGSGEGSASIEEKVTTYVRYPDGHSALVGRGRINTDPRAVGKLISENGSHIIFVSPNAAGGASTAVQLEGNAPPDGTQAIYDRTADEVTHVVSLLPGNVTPGPGQNALYVGASLDGRGVAFSIGNTLYLRHDNAETYDIGDGVTYAGIAEGGGRIFYLEDGDLFAFDVQSRAVIPFSSSGDVTVVNVAGMGSSAYFVSPSRLTTEPNSSGATAKVGQNNLYLSEEGAISFVATVTERDVKGTTGNVSTEGLGLWVDAVGPGQLARDPSRSTPDGRVLVFESRASLTDYDSEGENQIYRYDSLREELRCISCNPTLAAATGSASLQSISQGQGQPEPFGPYGYVPNLRSDGLRLIFQSSEPLVPTDTNGLQDVYEWEAQGVGSCALADGCVYLISSGHSDRRSYLYGVSSSGDDVFFRTADRLLPIDTDETPSIYDARVGGGFLEAADEPCEGEACRPGMTIPPGLSSPAQPAIGARDNVRRCPKGKRKVRRHGKVRCVKKHRKHHRHSKHRASAKKKAGAKKKGAAK